MIVLAVDDEKLALESLTDAIKEADENAEIHSYQKTKEALAYASQVRCDVAFLDVNMRGMTGLEMAARLKVIFPRTNIIFVTGYNEYMQDAFNLRASGYILKPVTREAIRRELDNLRYAAEKPLRNETEEKTGRQVRIQTFGNFEIYVNGRPVQFSRSKSKEILAYLIDRRGTGVTKREIASTIWEDSDDYSRSKQQQLQVMIAEMLKALKNAGADDVVIRGHNFLSVDVAKVDCDYYRFLEWDMSAVNSFAGEYMTNYSWAEFETGYLVSQMENHRG